MHSKQVCDVSSAARVPHPPKKVLLNMLARGNMAYCAHCESHNPKAAAPDHFGLRKQKANCIQFC